MNNDKDDKYNTINCSTTYASVFLILEKVLSIDLIFQQLKELLNDTLVGTNNLLNVTRRFHYLKKENLYLKLNKQFSLIYHNSSDYRENITLLINTKKQLSLNFSVYCDEFVNASVLDVHALDVSRCNIADVRPFRGLHSLNLSQCKSVIDVSSLSQVVDLNLSYCKNISDFRALSGLHKLNLQHCYNLTDVRALGELLCL
jgi:hypothetical protein